jgi:hypothetical protein
VGANCKTVATFISHLICCFVTSSVTPRPQEHATEGVQRAPENMLIEHDMDPFFGNLTLFQLQEYLICKDLEGGGRGLFEGTIKAVRPPWNSLYQREEFNNPNNSDNYKLCKLTDEPWN